MPRNAAILLLAALCATSAIPQAASPRFEVAVIRANNGEWIGSEGPGLRHGSLRAQNVTLRRLIANAYNVTDQRVIGPSWLTRDHFDLAGKSPEGVPDRQFPIMLHALLEDRFALKAHEESRNMPVYFLTVAKDGPRLRLFPAPDPGPTKPGEPGIAGFPMIRGALFTSDLAAMLGNFLERPVIDKTGLTKQYSVFLSFAPLTPKTSSPAPEFTPPDLFTAVQKQLGLRLDSGKDDVSVVVVDHVEPTPTDN
jgi:uncharacterized protein (TIGR03435 family)